jgi:hypothetical protein
VFIACALRRKHAIRIERSGELLKTPNGKTLCGFNEKLIERVMCKFQGYSEIKLDEANSIIGEPLEKLGNYVIG